MSRFFTDGPCPWCRSASLHPLSRQRLANERGVMIATCVDCRRKWSTEGQDCPTVPDGSTVTIGPEKAEHLAAIQFLLSWLTAIDGRKSITFARSPRGSHVERM